MEASAGKPHAFGILALGVWLAASTWGVRVSLALAVLGALGSIGAATAMRGTTAVETLPMLASTGFAWIVGTTLAAGGALRALQNDRERGIVALARARGVGPGAYASGRVGGLVVVLAVAVSGGTLVAGLAATAVSADHASAVARASAAALVYSLAFALTLGPVAMAALGGASRAGGYLLLLLVLVIPELVAPWTKGLLPAGWDELTSVTAALEAVRAGVQTAGPAVIHAARAVVGLLGLVAASLIVVRARTPQPGAGEDA